MYKRFWDKVNIRNEDECWFWHLDTQSYGFFVFNGKTQLAHRVAYQLAHGEGSADGKVVRHSCDNSLCCNPKHLLLGTQQDNMNDKIQRGRARHFKGDECSWRKLNREDVVEIKAWLKKRTQKDIAAAYNVNRTTINDIACGRTWRNI